MTKWSASDLLARIHRRFAAPAYAVLENVRNGTGYAKRERYADAVAMGLWPSRGIDVHGMEIKVSRSDWQAELKQPEKAQAIQQYCDYWWVVAPDGVVQLAELPPNWGLLVPSPKGKGLVAQKDAPKLTATPLDRGFIASCLRNVSKKAVRGVEPRDALAWAERERVLQEREDRAVDLLRSQHESQMNEIKQRIARFEEASGVEIDRWTSGHVGAAVKAVLAGRLEPTRRAAADMAERLRRLAEAAQQNVTEMDEILKGGT